MTDQPLFTPEQILEAYASGWFPMAHDDAHYWHAPDPRAIVPLDAFRTTRSLRSLIRRGRYTVRIDHAFDAVIEGCARRDETWISEEIATVMRALFNLGFAHSVSVYDDEGLAGGLYGLVLGGAFFGESMFSDRTNASKVALVHLVEHLRARDFVLLDIQFMTEHLARFGATEIPRLEYERRLEAALARSSRW